MDRIKTADGFWGTGIPGVHVLDVEIEGSWDYSRGWWSGIAVCEGRFLVSMSFGRQKECVEWSKTSDRDTDALPVNFHLMRKSSDSLDATAYFRVGEGNPGPAIYSVSPSSTYLPDIPERRVVRTGEILRLVTVMGEPEAEFGALFLAREDVTFVRKRIWRLRKHLIVGAPQPWSSIFTFGRHGFLQTHS